MVTDYATGADEKQLADAIGYDDRIGRKFLNAGLGCGGGCLPKDIRAFMGARRRAGRGSGALQKGRCSSADCRWLVGK